MIIYLGADHEGFNLKEKIKESLMNEGYSIVDMGAEAYVADDDYPDYAAKVAEAVGKDPENNRGILLCRSGFGMDIVANKFPGVRAALPASPDHMYQGRHDDNVNVLVIGADFMDEEGAFKVMKTFLATPYARDVRYERRLEKISKMENVR